MTTKHRIAITTLESPTYWTPGRMDIEKMKAEHALNCIRMLERDPLATLLGVIRAHDQDFAWSEDSMSAPTPPTIVSRLLDEAAARRTLENAGSQSGVSLEGLDEIVRPLHEIEAEALAWIRRTPTRQALMLRVWNRLLSGEANIIDMVDPQ